MRPIPIDQAVAIALEQHQAGNLERAERLYVEILRQDAGNVDAMHLLGVLARQGKNPEAAVRMISAAIQRRPDVAVFHYNLAEAYHTLGKREEAIAAYTRALELDPNYSIAHNNLSDLLNDAGRHAEGERAAREALRLDPDNPNALNNLGVALRGLGRHGDALETFRSAVARQPDLVPAVCNLAMCLCYHKRMDEGIATFRRAIELDPTAADVHNNLGTAYVYDQQVEAAGECFQRAIDIKPDHLHATNNLGSVLRSVGKVTEAVVLFRRAVELKPDFVEGRMNLAMALADVPDKAGALAEIDAALALRPRLTQGHFLRGVILRDLGRPDDGIDAIRHALTTDPDYVPALTALGYSLLERGDLDEAMAALTRSTELNPDPITHSNVLMAMNYHPGFSPADLLAAHRGWADLHERPHADACLPHENDRSPDRPLRVGYVSPDFRGHSVANFLKPILAHHDHDRVEVYAYAHLTHVDMDTWGLRSQVDAWRETAGRTPEQVSEQIRADRIDVLVDLAGHTGGNSLPVFARRPAPVQVNMIGFPSTTGLSAMDYRITDGRCDPPGESDRNNSERLVRLPDLFWAYEPPANAPAVGPLPADSNGRVTFASINNFTKVTPQVQALWAELLRAVPQSRLILQTSALASDHTRRAVAGRFAANGVDPDRIDIRESVPFGEFLRFLDEEVDLTLDPFPFNGGTTTCHSLWMGVPVLTLAGDRHAARMGLSMMTAVGLGDLVAHDRAEFVKIAQDLCGDLPRLRELRRGMRERLRASPLLDAAGYTAHLEAAYRQAWRTWCESRS